MQLLRTWCQQPPENIDDPAIVDVPVVGHGTVLGPVGTTVDWFCSVGSGKGLRPPVPSSVDPSGIPARPAVVREPTVGDEADAVGLDDAVVALAHVPDAVPAIAALSNSGVGAEVPDIAPVAEDSPGSEPLVEFPMPEAAVRIAPMVPEHAEGVVIVIALEAEEPDVIGLTPGVASSVAPSGRPVPPTGAPAPIPSGEVIPSGGVTAPMPTCANAAPTLHNDQTVAAAKIPFAVFCALQFFIPDLSYSRGFLPRNWHEIDRSGSPDRDGGRHIELLIVLAIHGSSPLRKVGVGYWEHFSSSVAAPIATGAEPARRSVRRSSLSISVLHCDWLQSL
jgi:hypothetical protein